MATTTLSSSSNLMGMVDDSDAAHSAASDSNHDGGGDGAGATSDSLILGELAKVNLNDDSITSDDIVMKAEGKQVLDSPMSDSDVPNATPLSDAASLMAPCSPRHQGQLFLGTASHSPVMTMPQQSRNNHNNEQDDHLTPLINLDDNDDDEPSSCPATRAMEAARAIASSNEQLIREELELLQQQQHKQEEEPLLEQNLTHITLTPKVKNSFLEMSFSREDTFRTDNKSGGHSHNENVDDGQTNFIGERVSSLQQRQRLQESNLFIPSVSSSSGPNPNHFPPRQHQPLSVDERYDDASSDCNKTNQNGLHSNATANESSSSSSLYTFSSHTLSGRALTLISTHFVPPQKRHTHGGSALAGFAALLLVTCANYMLGPMRDAAALAVGVTHIPALTLASTVLALGSSVPVGWLFEAPDPRRRRVWKRMGLTRGETQGTSLALFYRVFAFLLLSYALGFQVVERFGKSKRDGDGVDDGGERSGLGEEESAVILLGCLFLRILGVLGIPTEHPLFSSVNDYLKSHQELSIPSLLLNTCSCIVNKFGKVIYIMFFLVVHLMKLHSLSLIWGVTTEAMEYEENAEQRRKSTERNITKISSGGGLIMMGGGNNNSLTRGGSSPSSSPSRARSASFSSSKKQSKSSLRLKRLAFVGFGGTLGGIIGSVIASFAAHILHLSGLLVIAAIMLEISANLSVELGRIMQRHWEEQMRFQSSGDLASMYNSTENLATCDSSMKKSVSLSSMKRVASGSLSSGNLANLAAQQQGRKSNRSYSISEALTEKDKDTLSKAAEKLDDQPMIDDSSFKQRLLRGVTTILRSRLLMAIFTYNALYASTSVLLSFQRAELVANRSSSGTSAVSNTAFLAKINTASSVAVFALQASGLGAYIANSFGQRGALALMPIIRLCGVFLLGYWHLTSNGKPPDLIMFLVIDEFTKVINFAIAKPVRENLWRGLSAEARYEAKPIVDTLANRWGGGSAAFLVSFINRITDLTGLGVVKENGERSIFGFPPVLLLCMIISAWWTAVSADVGNIRRKIDIELKKQQ
mmetsp:Transcript_13256/g.21747  ORF Transcript_13256/g.21747 Transcript_13256/m.21747 type:complete len:1038 (+) Transcript_13256:201-3314(+)